MDQEEKLRLRREKLAKWKQKKQTNISNNDVYDTKGPDTQTEGIQKLAGCKSKKQAQSALAQKRRKTKGGSAFGISDGESDNEHVPTKLFKPGVDDEESQNNSKTLESNSEDDIDNLDRFIMNLEQKRSAENSKTVFNTIIMSDEELDSDYTAEEDEANTEYGQVPKFKAKKRIRRIDYSKESHLVPFNKALYHEPNDLASMTEKEVEELRLSLDNIKVFGHDCPKPVMKWSQLGLSSEIMDLITNHLQFVALTPIQSQAIPAIMSGRDVIGISKTGSGKTVAFLLPLIRQLKAQPPLKGGETGPIGLILTPTRELAVQIQEEVSKFVQGSGIQSICCVGGSELKQQINSIKKGVEIVVATPGRFIDLLTLNSGNLLSPKRISFLVMDEADRLFDLGFGPQVNQIVSSIRPDKQCVLFSATFPAKLKNFASRTLSDPIQISINSKSLINENIQQKVQIFDEEPVKFEFLLKTLRNRLLVKQEEDEKTIVFVSSQQICDLLYEELLINGITTYPIHAGKPSSERLQNLQKFKDTNNGILICTEVLSRGLNVPAVSLVIIYNAAKTISQYVHTAGRTGRGSNKGIAITFLMVHELSAAYILVKCMKDNELSTMPMVVYQKLKEMNDEFSAGLKTGKYRIVQGFGGKGLEHLDEITEAKHNQEWNESESIENEGEEDKSLTKMEYTRGKRQEGKTTTYYAHININDLPQIARWEATKTETLSSVKQETGCNFENRGKFYPEGHSPKKDSDEPKLYLIVESANENDVTMALELLDSKVKEGVRKSTLQEMKSGKYRL